MSLISTTDLVLYTDSEKVKARDVAKLEMDIRRAQSKILQHLKRTETDSLFIPAVPQAIKDSLILYAEFLSLKEIEKQKAGISAESFDDYSYTRSSNGIEEPDVFDLLDEYILGEPLNSNKVVLKARFL